MWTKEIERTKKGNSGKARSYELLFMVLLLFLMTHSKIRAKQRLLFPLEWRFVYFEQKHANSLTPYQTSNTKGNNKIVRDNCEWHIRKHQIDIKAVEICQIKTRNSAHFTQSIQTKHHPHLYRRRHSQRHCDGVISFTLLVSLLFFSSKIKYHARDSQFFLLNTFVQIICNSEQRILIFVLVFFEWCRSLAHVIFIYCFENDVIYRHIYNLTEKDFSISMFSLLFHL